MEINTYKNKNKFNDKYTIIKKFACDITHKDLMILNEKPDCLYADCEGCLYDFQNTVIGKYILNNVRFIVNEMDGFVKVNNKETKNNLDNNKILDKKIRQQWSNSNHIKLTEGYGCGTRCNTEVWVKK